MVPVIEEFVQPTRQKTSTPSFLIKTFNILENQRYQDIITWNLEGDAFVVKNPTQLAQHVLPNYFKHNNFSSFVRQLNMYDFHKLKNDNGENQFKHKYFQRGNKYLLCQIKRKQVDTLDILDDKNGSSNPISNTNNELEINKLKNDYQFFLNELIGVKGKQHEIQKTMLLAISQIEHLINENLSLWSEIRRIKETESRKIDTLSYLLATFITTMSPNSNGQSLSSMMMQQEGLDQSIKVKINENNNDYQPPPSPDIIRLQYYNGQQPIQQNRQQYISYHNPQASQHSQFLQQLIHQQRQLDQSLQNIKQDISDYDASNRFTPNTNQCQQFIPCQFQQQDQNPVLQENSRALLQQLMKLNVQTPQSQMKEEQLQYPITSELQHQFQQSSNQQQFM